MAQVFLSYARDDVGKAKSLAAAIERAGYSVWWDRDLEGGAEYSREIDDALKAAGVVVVLWSKDLVSSAWVRDEAAAGRDSGRLVPVRLDGSEPPLGFRQYQTIDLSRWNGRSDSAGLKTLQSAIATKTGQRVAAEIVAGPSEVRRASRRPWRALMAALLVLLAVGSIYMWFAGRAARNLPAIAIIAADESATDLAHSLTVDIGSLKAITADSFELRDGDGDAANIDYLVRVATARRGQAVIADLTLSSRENPQILWTSRNTQANGDQSALQQQAASRVANLLTCLGEARPPSGTQLSDDATLRLYLQGCTRIEDRVGGSVESELISLFRQVTERAPRFAPAWANLAHLESNSTTLGRAKNGRGMLDQVRMHLERARALDPTLGTIYQVEADMFGYDWEQRQPILREGLRHDPDHAGLHSAMSIDLRNLGRINDAVDSALRAAELNPLSPRVQASTVPILSAAGRIAEARRQLERIERLWPEAPAVTNARYAFDLRYGDPVNALAMLRSDPTLSASMIAATGLPNPAVERFLEARIDPTPAKIDAAVNAYLDLWRKDPTTIDIPSIVSLGRIGVAYNALQNPLTLKAYANVSGVFFRAQQREFRRDPRFMPLVARLGLVRYWRKTDIWPDFCLEPDLPYDCKVEAAKFG